MEAQGPDLANFRCLVDREAHPAVVSKSVVAEVPAAAASSHSAVELVVGADPRLRLHSRLRHLLREALVEAVD